MSVTIGDGVTLTVEVGFSTTAGAGKVPINSTLSSITWTDISADVRSLSTTRGRSSELNDFTTGSLQLVLSNADRKYDPEYAAGAYYGKLTPGRPIRVKAQPSGGSTSGVFLGFVDEWNQQYDAPNDATALVTASDGFKVLNLMKLPSFWEYQIRTDGPTAWFRFDDGDTPTAPYETIAGKPVGQWKTIAGAATTGSAGSTLVVGDSTVSAKFDGTAYVDIPVETFPFNYNSYLAKSVECWIQTTTTTNGNYGIFYKPGDEYTIAIGMTVSGGIGTIQGQWGSVAGATVATAETSAVTVNDGKAHHVALRWDWNTAAHQLYVDGVLATSSTSFSTTPPTETNITVGKGFTSSATSAYNFTNAFVGTVDELALYATKALTSTQIANHYAIGKGNYLAGQTASDRISTLLSMAGWMSDATNIAASTTTVQGIDTEGKTVLAALKECETADQGRLFIDGNGKVAFISSNALAATATYNTSQRTFGDGAGELPYTDVGFVYNDQLVKNRVSVSRQNGATATVNDIASQDQYFIRDDSLSGFINDSDAAITDIANVLLATYSQPATRIPTLEVNPRANTTLYTGLLGDELGTRITVNRRPQGVGLVISKQLLIEGVSHDIGPRSWTSTYNLSPVPLAFLVLDDDTYGLWDDFYWG